MEKKSFYITTTLPYVNASLHMGHALEFVRADTIARYKKLQGYEVFFNTGTDEHGLKIFEKAKENGIDTQAFVDQGFQNFKKQLQDFGISDDIHFIRTTDDNHILAVQEFWKRVRDKGYIYKKNYEAKYCVGCESEKTDSELDENGECIDHKGKPLEIIKEENYFFKYSEFQNRLLEFYENNPNFVIPEFRYNEIKSFVKNGLQDFSISRLKTKMPWGVPVPDDEEHVMYVWFDALVNYISTLGWPDSHHPAYGTPPQAGGEELNFQKFWVHGTPTQYCGKDNNRFQSAMWQAMLMAAEVPSSHQIIVNGFITADGGVKMSKTVGNVVDPSDVVSEYGTDALRYFLLREVSSFEDSPFTIERFKDCYNAGLANGLGNLTSRIMKMAETNLNERVDILEMRPDAVFLNHINNFNLQKASELIWLWVGELDAIIQNEQPFKLIKTDPEKAKEIIKNLVQKLYQIAEHLTILLPETAEKIKNCIRENKVPSEPLFLRK